jgi:hypothetical protein
MSIHGGRANDLEIQLDGMNTSSWNRLDSSIVLFTDGNIAEYAVETAGKTAESETAGVRVNMIPREGSNAFRGSFFANFANPSLQSDNLTQDLINRGLPTPNKIKLVWDVNPTFGGPIKRDKLWFFSTYSRIRSDSYIGGLYYNTNTAAWTYTPDKTRQGVNDQIAWDTAVRLTWQASAKHKIAFYYDHNDNCNCHFLVSPSVAPEAGVVSTGVINVFQATWTAPLTNRFLMEGGFSTLPQDKRYDVDPTAQASAILEQSSNFLYRSRNNLYRKERFENRTVRASASYVTGQHAAKVGFTAVFGSSDTYFYDPFGSVLYTLLNGTPSRVTYYGLPIEQFDYLRPNLGIYAQDQWIVRRLTLNGGVRFDWLKYEYPDHNSPATQWVPVPRVFPGTTVLNWQDLSPRLGATYDMFGNGKTAVKWSLGRYVLADGLTRRTTINPLAQNNSNARTWTDANRDLVVQGDPFNPALNGELGPSTNASFGKPVITTQYDPEWSRGFGKRAYNWELSTGVQHELFPRVAVNASYFHRWYGNFEITDNLATTAADYDPFCVTTPVDARLPGGGAQTLCGFSDLKPSKVGQVNNIVTSSDKYGNRMEHWDGIDVTMNARMAHGVLVQGGISTGKTTENFCAIRDAVPEASYAAALIGVNATGTSYRWCDAESPFLTQFKLLGSYTLPWQQIQVAATVQSIPGPVIQANYVATSAQIAPSLGRQLSSAANVTLNIVEPGSMYVERMNQVDLRFGKTFNIGRLRAQGMFDLYNAFNDSGILGQNDTYGSNGASWQVPQVILGARLAKFSVQLNF